MPFKQAEAENLTSVEPFPGTRGQLKLWKKGQEVMVEIYGPWGTLLGHITVEGLRLQEAIELLAGEKSRIIGKR